MTTHDYTLAVETVRAEYARKPANADTEAEKYAVCVCIAHMFQKKFHTVKVERFWHDCCRK